MKFNFSADWTLSAGDIDWLTNSYFPDKLAVAVRCITEVRAFDGYAFDANKTSRFGNGIPEVNISLGSSDRGSAKGNFYELGENGNSAIPTIWINWVREMDSTNPFFGVIVRHELIHMLLWMQYPPLDGNLQRYSDEWTNSMHGLYAEKGKDIFLNMVNKTIDKYYPINTGSFPGYLPCGV